MADVVNINGYDVKDAQARQDIQNILNYNPQKTTINFASTDNSVTGQVNYVVVNNICYMSVNARSTTNYNVQVSLHLESDIPSPFLQTFISLVTEQNAITRCQILNKSTFVITKPQNIASNSYFGFIAYPIAIS